MNSNEARVTTLADAGELETYSLRYSQEQRDLQRQEQERRKGVAIALQCLESCKEKTAS